MRYLPTPLNIVSGLIVGFSIYSAIRPGSMGFGFMAFLFLLPIGLIFRRDLSETEMKAYSGRKLNSESIKLGFIRFSENEIDCTGKKYKYRRLDD